MMHLFIINPAAGQVRGKTSEIVAEIDAFFQSYPDIHYHTYVTRFARDAVGYVREYLLKAKSLVRVYSVGGTGTLFEVVNGAVGMPNVQIAYYPVGGKSSFIRYFGDDKKHLFSSLQNLVIADTVPLDVIHCGHNYYLGYSLIGVESEGTVLGNELKRKTRLSGDLVHIGASLYSVMRRDMQDINYTVTLDDKQLEGKFFTILVANAPCYGNNIQSAVDAHPNSGVIDVYVGYVTTKWRAVTTVSKYTSGQYCLIPDVIKHYTCKKMNVKSQQAMCMTVDGETFYNDEVDYEIIPRAIDFVCPTGIDVDLLPKTFGGRERKKHI